jgi:hypothetical protein
LVHQSLWISRLSITNALQPAYSQTLIALFQWCTKIPNDVQISLISRYFNICSSYISFQSEMENFKKTFSSNGYPKALIDSCVKTFLIITLKTIPYYNTFHLTINII